MPTDRTPPLIRVQRRLHLLSQESAIRDRRARAPYIELRALNQSGVRDRASEARRQWLRTHLVLTHLPLIVTAIRRLQSRYDLTGVDLDELASEGIFGLTQAVDAYDPSRGVQFSTLAVLSSYRAMQSALPGLQSMLKVSIGLYQQLKKMRRRQEDKAKRGEALTAAEARQLYHMEMALRNRTGSGGGYFNSEGAEHPDLAVWDTTGAQHEEQTWLMEQVDRVLATCSERERDIFLHRHELQDRSFLTLAELGRRHGLTKERVRQIEARVWRRLIHHIQETHPCLEMSC